MNKEIVVIMKAIQAVQANQIELASRIDGLEVMVASVGAHVGIDAAEFSEKLRAVQANCHQKRLEIVENRNPSAAADLDLRPDIPPFDPDLTDPDIGPPIDPAA